MDKLALMWQDQLSFTDMVLNKTRGLTLDQIDDDDLVSLTNLYVLSMHSELSEILEELPWREHRVKDNAVRSRDNLLEELVDVQHFLLGLTQVHGFTMDEYLDAFLKKTTVNTHRLTTKEPLKKPYVVVDIDGVLYEHYEAWNKWISEVHPELVGASKIDNALAWQEARYEFRESHKKQEGNVNAENVAALHKLKDNGYSIVLLSYRPAHLHKKLEHDTIIWLSRHNVPCDRLIFSAYEKYQAMQTYLREADIFIEDEPETCRLVNSIPNGPIVYRICSIYDTILGEQYNQVNDINQMMRFRQIGEDTIL